MYNHIADMSLIAWARGYALPTLISKSPMLSSSLVPARAVLNCTPLRTYMDNFHNKNTNIKPHIGWMHQDRARQAYRTDKANKRREYIRTYSEVKRIRTYGYEKRMSTEGGRKMLMRRILRGKDDLAH